MVARYVKHITTTPQTAPVPGREADMSQNAAGGYAFDLDCWARLNRWLIIGASGGTFYTGEQVLTVDNAATIVECLRADGLLTVERIVAVSETGRAPKNDPAIFALAVAAKMGDEPTRTAAYAALPRVCRTGTHLFNFVTAIDALGGWSRGARRAVAGWYTNRDVDSLAYQLVKYRSRDGWSHKDVIRLSHPKPVFGDERGWLLRWAVGKQPEMGTPPRIVEGFLQAQQSASPARTAALVREYRLPREAVRTDHLSDPAVVEAILYDAPLGSLIRNLGNATKAGVIAPFSDATALVVGALGNAETIRAARIHPMAIFLALKTYASGHGLRGHGAWEPVQQVVDALDDAFYSAMATVVPTGKRLLVAIDVSGSMQMEAAGLPVSASEAAAAMALIVAKTEPDHHIIGINTTHVPLPISPGQRLDRATEVVRRVIGGGTDLSVAATWLLQQRRTVDGLLLLTDNETWAGYGHPSQQMNAYRHWANAPVRNVVASMTATQHSVGDPNDPLTLQCVGLDASTPEVVRGFLAGEF